MSVGSFLMEGTAKLAGGYKNLMTANKSASNYMKSEMQAIKNAKTMTKNSKNYNSTMGTLKKYGINEGNLEEARKVITDAKGNSVSRLDNLHGNLKKASKGKNSAEVITSLTETGAVAPSHYAGLAKNYFWGGQYNKVTGGQRAARIGTAVGGYMGVNMIGRAITGGSLGRNNTGESDIAGIPFL